MAYLHLTCRLLVAGVFLVAAAKLRGRAAFGDFVRAVRRLRLVPDRLAAPVAAAVVAAELMVVGLLAVPGGAVSGFVLAGLLSTVFLTVIAVAVRRGAAVRCHCFGSSGTPIGPAHMWRNALLLGVAVIGAGTASAAGPVAMSGAAVSLVAALAGVLLVVFFVDFVSLLTDPFPQPDPPARRLP